MTLTDNLLHLWRRIRGEPTPEERERYTRSVRLALHIEEEIGEIDRRLDRILGSQVDVKVRRNGNGEDGG